MLTSFKSKKNTKQATAPSPTSHPGRNRYDAHLILSLQLRH
jgi:hypothetical protein